MDYLRATLKIAAPKDKVWTRFRLLTQFESAGVRLEEHVGQPCPQANQKLLQSEKSPMWRHS